jgi:hypothetical protein
MEREISTNLKISSFFDDFYECIYEGFEGLIENGDVASCTR